VADLDASLTPAQREVLAHLTASAEDAPSFDAGLRLELRATLEEGVADAAASLPDGQDLWVGKSRLANVLGCEGRFLADDADGFGWTPAMARGTVAHKAIELGISWRGPMNPSLLVDVAIERLVDEGYSLGTWLTEVDEATVAEVRGEATERVTTFEECFPPLKPEWRPKPESKVKAYLAGGRIVLQGKVDLTIGRARGLEARKVLLDLKTGAFQPVHRDDLRFYALVETLKLGTPPRLLGTFELDAGVLHGEDVTLDVLDTAVRRTVDGVNRLVELLHGGADAEPRLRTGPLCRFCSRNRSCEPGIAYLRERDESAGQLLDL
jgi:hypothetical protein